MATEDEAVQMALKTGELTITTAKDIIEALIGLLRAKQQGAVAGGADKEHKILDVVGRGVDKHVLNKHGKLGEVSESELRRQAEKKNQDITYVPTPTVESSVNGRKDIDLLRKELKKAGITFSVIDRNDADGNPTKVIAVKAPDNERLLMALEDIGRREFGMTDEELDPKPVKREKDGSYPDEFDCRGMHFTRAADRGEKTWVASSPDDEHTKVYVTDNGNDTSHWSVERLGEKLSEGDCRPCDNGDWLRDSEGKVINGPNGAPLSFVPGGPITADSVNDKTWINKLGEPVEGAAAAAKFHLGCMNRPEAELTDAKENAQAVKKKCSEGKGQAVAKPTADDFTQRNEKAHTAALATKDAGGTRVQNPAKLHGTAAGSHR